MFDCEFVLPCHHLTQPETDSSILLHLGWKYHLSVVLETEICQVCLVSLLARMSVGVDEVLEEEEVAF